MISLSQESIFKVSTQDLLENQNVDSQKAAQAAESLLSVPSQELVVSQSNNGVDKIVISNLQTSIPIPSSDSAVKKQNDIEPVIISNVFRSITDEDYSSSLNRDAYLPIGFANIKFGDLSEQKQTVPSVQLVQTETSSYSFDINYSDSKKTLLYKFLKSQNHVEYSPSDTSCVYQPESSSFVLAKSPLIKRKRSESLSTCVSSLTKSSSPGKYS